MANHFKQAQADLERLGFEHVSTNTQGGQTWAHPTGHCEVIHPGIKEHQHRSLLRDCRKATGVKTVTNKRNVAQVKDRQAKQRATARHELEARSAWLEARIRDLELAASLRTLTTRQQRTLRERLTELGEIRTLMQSIPGGAA